MIQQQVCSFSSLASCNNCKKKPLPHRLTWEFPLDVPNLEFSVQKKTRLKSCLVVREQSSWTKEKKHLFPFGRIFPDCFSNVNQVSARRKFDNTFRAQIWKSKNVFQRKNLIYGCKVFRKREGSLDEDIGKNKRAKKTSCLPYNQAREILSSNLTIILLCTSCNSENKKVHIIIILSQYLRRLSFCVQHAISVTMLTL